MSLSYQSTIPPKFSINLKATETSCIKMVRQRYYIPPYYLKKQNKNISTEKNKHK